MVPCTWRSECPHGLAHAPHIEGPTPCCRRSTERSAEAPSGRARGQTAEVWCPVPVRHVPPTLSAGHVSRRVGHFGGTPAHIVQSQLPAALHRRRRCFRV